MMPLPSPRKPESVRRLQLRVRALWQPSGHWILVAAALLALATLASLAAPSSAIADEPAGTLATDSLAFGSMFVSADPASDKEVSLTSRPIGTDVFTLPAEVPTGQKLEPGMLVDVSLVTLGEEGAKAERILRDITIYSLGKYVQTAPQPEKASVDGESEPDGKEEETEEAEVLPVRLVGLLTKKSQWEKLRLAQAQGMIRLAPSPKVENTGVFSQVLHNFIANLFQPLLLFFFMGFAIPLLKVPFEFPKPLYQSLTIYLLVAIGWHGGELMAAQPAAQLAVAGGLALIGFFTNATIGFTATKLLDWFTPMRKIDTTTVGAYYGSDSAGTFVTCLGILATLNILHDSYMPVLLAVMEIPGCLVGLFLVAKLRRQGMDVHGNMPGEPDYAGASAGGDSHGGSIFSMKIVHEVFFNPGLYMLFGGIVVGFISGLQALEDPHVVEGPNHLFLFIFKGALCLFLLEMGITACERLRDLKTAGIGFILFGVLAPNLFATFGMCVLHVYALALGHDFELGTYALFAVLTAAASYIAVPAVQRLAIPEASPTLPLAASLGLTFTWNVTIGIPIYIEIAKAIIKAMPIG